MCYYEMILDEGGCYFFVTFIHKSVKYVIIVENHTISEFAYNELTTLDDLMDNTYGYDVEQPTLDMITKSYDILVDINAETFVDIVCDLVTPNNALVPIAIDFPEIYEWFICDVSYLLLTHIDDQPHRLCEAAVKSDGWALSCVNEPTLDLCLLAIKSNINALVFVVEPTYDMRLFVSQYNAASIEYTVGMKTIDICIHSIQSHYKAYGVNSIISFLSRNHISESVYIRKVKQEVSAPIRKRIAIMTGDNDFL